MTQYVLTAAAFVLTAFLLILAIRLWQRERVLLYVMTPLLLGGSLYTGHAIDKLLGYATNDLSELEEDFYFLRAFSGENVVYLLGVPKGSEGPRLYVMQKSEMTEEEQDGVDAAQAKTNKGIPQIGSFREGEAAFHDFDIEEEVGPKDQEGN